MVRTINLKIKVMYNLNEDAITKIPTFFGGLSSKPIVTLDVAKEKL
jgi:hypothetical protein